MFSITKRKLNRGEKTLALVSALAIAVLITLSQVRPSVASGPSNTEDAKALESTTKALISAMRNGDQKQVKRLTTTQGFVSIQKSQKDKRFGNYQNLSTRLAGEWGDNDDWGFCLRPDQQNHGMSHNRFGKPDGGLTFKRVPKGWKVDRYEPSSEKTFKQYSRARAIQRRANAMANNNSK